MNSTRNPQSKSTADVVPDIEQPSPQIQASSTSCNVTPSTATANAVLLNHSHSIDDNEASYSEQLTYGKSLEIVDQPGNDASFSTNHGSTHSQDKPDDSVTSKQLASGKSLEIVDQPGHAACFSMNDGSTHSQDKPDDSVTSKQLTSGKSLEIVDQPGHAASFSTNDGSTHGQDKPDDSVTMGSAVIYMDVLEKMDTDAASGCHGSFLIDGEFHAYRRYRNPGFCSRQSKHSQQESDTGATTIEAIALKFDDDGQEDLDDRRRRSGRKRKPAHPTNIDQHAGSKVTELEFLRSKRGCVVVELSDDVMPGDKLLIAWPKDDEEVNDDGLPQYFLCEVPKTVSPPKKKKPRLLRVMAPDFDGSPRKRRSGGDRYKHGSPHKSSVRSSFQSPQKAQWSSYQKTTSRVGELYQVPSLPPAVVIEASHSAETAVQGYGTLWDCRLAEEAERNGEQLERFLDLVPRDRVMLMEILHRNNYKVEYARDVLLDALHSECHQDLTPFNSQETDAFAKFIMEDFWRDVGPDSVLKPYFSKRFSKIAQHLGRSVDACLRHYYTKFKKGPMYKALKRKIRERKEAYSDETEDREDDICALCQDGGELISCDKCFRDFHRMCLRPPLLIVPAGDWFCPDCNRANRLERNQAASRTSDVGRNETA